MGPGGKGRSCSVFWNTECVTLHLLEPEALVVGRMKVHTMDFQWDRGAAARHGAARHFNFGVLVSDAVEST